MKKNRITNKPNMLRSGFLTMLLLLLASVGFAQGGTVTVNLWNHNGPSGGTGISGAVAQYSTGSAWVTIGTTNAAGTCTGTVPAAASRSFRIQYLGISSLSITAAVTNGGSTTVDFATSQVTFNLYDHNGDPLAGGTAKYYNNSVPGTVALPGNTVAAGANPSIELLPSATIYGFYMLYNGGIQTINQAVPTGGTTYTANFRTTLVTVDLKNCGTGALLSGGTAKYYNNSVPGTVAIGTTVNAGTNPFIELLPVPYTFYMVYGGVTQTSPSTTITNSGGTSYTQEIDFTNCQTVTINLKDHTGALFTTETGTAQYYDGTWHTIGVTSNGVITQALAPGSYYFNMTYHNYTQQVGPINVTANMTETFQTTLVTLNLKHHDGSLITDANAGMPGYYNSQTTTWVTGTTGTTGNEQVELLPGDGYYFNMNYNNYTQQVGSMSVTGSPWTQTVDFRTTLVTLNLKDHTGALIPDNTDAGGFYNSQTTTWVTGTLTSGGVSKELLPGDGYYFNMNYNNYTQQVGSMSVTGSPWTQTVDFRTTLVTLNLKDHTGALIPDNTDAGGFYNSQTMTWVTGTLASGSVSKELLPGDGYFFNMNYNDYTQQVGSMSVAGGSPWTQTQDFQTTLVTLNLKDHTGTVMSSDNTDLGGFYNSQTMTWVTGTLTGGSVSKELLAGDGYFFNMNYNNYTQQVGSMSVAGGSPWTQSQDFKTSLVSLNLKDCSGGSPTLINTNGGTGGFYNSQTSVWMYGTTTGGTVSKELLPGPGYYFNMAYNYGSVQIGALDVSSAPTQDEDFSTTKVTFTNPNPSAGGVMYYETGWNTFTPNTMNLLPGNYYFQINGGAVFAKTIGGCAPQSYAIAPTGELGISVLNNGGCGGSYTLTGPAGASSYVWTPGGATTQTIEVNSLGGVYSLTANYDFTNTGGTITPYTDNTASLTIAPRTVTIRLIDSKGNGIQGAAVKYYNSGWQTFDPGALGLTDINGYACMSFPTPTFAAGFAPTFEVVYRGGTKTWVSAVSTNPILVAQTNDVTLSLNNSTGSPEAGGTAGYYDAGWKSIAGTTVASGANPDIELLPGTYSFNMAFNSFTQQSPVTAINATPAQQSVNFHTTLVTVNLNSSTGSPLAGGTAGYYANGWHAIAGSTVTSGANPQIELLAGAYTFNMTYLSGIYQQPTATTINSTPAQCVNFTTTLVTASLNSSTGAPLDGGVAGYYASGWRTLGTTDATGTASLELLPTSYSFNMLYKNGTQQSVATSVYGLTTAVPFTTKLITILFEGKTGTPHSGAAINYYSNGWHPLGTTGGDGLASMELLPAAYSYNATLAGFGTTQVGPFTDGVNNTHTIKSTVAARQAAPGATTAETDFDVYPNPTSDKITIKFSSATDKQASVRVADMSGRVIINEAISSPQGINTYDVELGNLANGIYLLMFDNGDNNEVRKINVQH